MRLLIRVLLALSVATRVFAQIDHVSAHAAAADAFQLSPAAPSVTRTLVVDRAAALSFLLTSSSRTLTVVLVTPSGSRFTIGDKTAPAGVVTEIDDLSANGKTGAAYAASIANPQPGRWSVSVTERTQLRAPLDIVTTAAFDNTTRAAVIIGDTDFPAGASIRVAAIVFDGKTRVTGATITAAVRGSSGAVPGVSIALHDDGTAGDEHAGDGIYEGVLPTTALAPAKYAVQIDATGTASTGAFERTASAPFRIVARDVQIDGFFDTGEDTDGDGFLDRIVVAARATLTASGAYRAAVRLRASNGNELLRSIDVSAPGTEVVFNVPFTAADIRQDLGVDGPYTIAEIRVSHITNGDVVPADVRYELGATGPYDLSGLQHATLRLTGAGTATGKDTDGNGLFDNLEVSLEVDVDYGGSYDASVSLHDRENHEIGFAAGTLTLNSGVNTLVITFDGRRIGSNGVDGPYTVTNLILFGEDQSLIATSAFVTPAFHASAFDGFRLPRRRPAAIEERIVDETSRPLRVCRLVRCEPCFASGAR